MYSKVSYVFMIVYKFCCYAGFCFAKGQKRIDPLIILEDTVN